MIFDDDHIVIEGDHVGVRGLCAQFGVNEWPPPEVLEIHGMRLVRERYSLITDEERLSMSHVARGAVYRVDHVAREFDTTDLVPGSCCATCGYPIEATTGLGSSAPQEGNISICLNCGEPQLFAETPMGWTTREPTVKERADIETRASFIEASRQIRKRGRIWPGA